VGFSEPHGRSSIFVPGRGIDATQLPRRPERVTMSRFLVSTQIDSSPNQMLYMLCAAMRPRPSRIRCSQMLCPTSKKGSVESDARS